jgi:hypothetical protein
MPDFKRPKPAFLKYSAMGTQMLITIVVFTLGGKYLDAYLNFSFKWFTLFGVLVGLFVAMYTAIKELIKK